VCGNGACCTADEVTCTRRVLPALAGLARRSLPPPPGPASPTPAPLPRTDMRRLTGAADKARRAAQAHRVADACALTDCQL